MEKVPYYYKLKKNVGKKKIKLIPTQTKFKRIRKMRVKKIQYKRTASDLNHGLYGIKLLNNGRLSTKQIETIRQKLSKHIKKKETLYCRTRANHPQTFKEPGLRMGKGKGDVKQWVSRVKAGDVLFELSMMTRDRAKLILLPVLKSIGIPAVVIHKKQKI